MKIFNIGGEMIFQPLLVLRFAHGQRIARTAADEQVAVLQNGFIFMPCGEVQQGVLSDDKSQRLVWTLFCAPFLKRLRGPGGRIATQLTLVKPEERLICDGQASISFRCSLVASGCGRWGGTLFGMMVTR